MDPISKSILIASLLGGVLATDVLVAFQFMISRPLVAAGLTGAALGEPGAGLALGGLMELIWAGALPVGSVVPPDFSLAAVFAAASAAIMRHAIPGLDWESCLVWALLWSIPLAWAAGHADQAQRRWHARLADRAMSKVAAGDESALGKAITLSVLGAFARGFALVAVSLLLLNRPMTWLLSRVAVTAEEALHWIYWLALMLGFAVLMDHFWERRWLKACAISFAVSVVLSYGAGIGGAWLLGVASLAALVAALAFERRQRA